ncbi:MAG: hypothetical protein LUF92_06285 [Clostridiales bacterium]|nr:hypothetical protein [Clostridiales bacterium]
MKNNFCVKKEDIFFLIAIMLFMFSIIIEMTEFAVDREGNDIQIIFTITKLMRYMSYILCVIKIVMKQKYSKGWYMLIVIVASLLFVGVMASETKTMFLYFWLVASAKGVQDKKIFKVSIFVQSFILCFTIGCSQLGIVEDYIYDNGDRLRHFLGFTWATTAPILFFYIILQYLYLKDMLIHSWEIVILMIVNIWMFEMTNTRFAFLLASAVLMFAFLYKHSPICRMRLERIKYLLVLAPEIIAAFSIWLHAAYDSESPQWYQLNELLSERLDLGYQAIQEYGYTLLGQRIEWYGVTQSMKLGQDVYNYVDCAYLQILLQYGFLFLLLVLVAYSVMMQKSIIEKRYSACWILLVILVFAITEPRLVNIAFNPFILLVMAETNQSMEEKVKRTMHRFNKMHGKEKTHQFSHMYLNRNV